MTPAGPSSSPAVVSRVYSPSPGFNGLGGGVIEVGRRAATRWEFAGGWSGEGVDLFLRRNGQTQTILALGAENTGVFEWVPSAGQEGDGWTVVVQPSAMDSSSSSSSRSGGQNSAAFAATGATEGPAFTIAPHRKALELGFIFDGQDGYEWTKGREAAIRWTAFGLPDARVDVDLMLRTTLVAGGAGGGGSGSGEIDSSDDRFIVLSIGKAVDSSGGGSGRKESELRWSVPWTNPPRSGFGYSVRVRSVSDPNVVAESQRFSLSNDLWEEGQVPKKLSFSWNNDSSSNPSSSVGEDDANFAPTTVTIGSLLTVAWETQGPVDFVDLQLLSRGSFVRFVSLSCAPVDRHLPILSVLSLPLDLTQNENQNKKRTMPRMNGLRTLADDIPNSGAFEWKVDDDLQPDDAASFSLRLLESCPDITSQSAQCNANPSSADSAAFALQEGDLNGGGINFGTTSSTTTATPTSSTNAPTDTGDDPAVTTTATPVTTTTNAPVPVPVTTTVAATDPPPASTTPPPPSSCRDLPSSGGGSAAWKDGGGAGCGWYALDSHGSETDRCRDFGSLSNLAGAGGRTAAQACCVCGGGKID